MNSKITKKPWQLPVLVELSKSGVAGTSKISSRPGTNELLFHRTAISASMLANHLSAGMGHVIANSVVFSSPSVIDVQNVGGDVGPS